MRYQRATGPVRSTHSDRIERWLGADECERLSKAMCNSMQKWYGTPIPVAGVPGPVYVDKQGDFVGLINGGQEACALDWMRDYQRMAMAKALRQHGGFASRAVLKKQMEIAQQPLIFSKITSTNGSNGAWCSAWQRGVLPAAGAAAAAAPGGTVPTSASTGAMSFVNADSGKKLWLTGPHEITCDDRNTSVLLYARIFAVAKTMNSTATEAVTGVPTLYQSITQGAEDSAENNFLFNEVGTALPATAHNWTVCQYTDQSGNVGVTLPSVTGISACATSRLDIPVGQWFMPLATGDTGIQQLTQMQCSALVATGTVDFVIGHPLAWLPQFSINFKVWMHGLLSNFGFARVFNDACLALLETIASTSSPNLLGSYTLVSD